MSESGIYGQAFGAYASLGLVTDSGKVGISVSWGYQVSAIAAYYMPSIEDLYN